MPTPTDRPYRVWLYRRYREVRLDGRAHLVLLNLDPTVDQQPTRNRLTRLFTQLTAADGATGWERHESQLLLTDTPDGVEPTPTNSFWWTPEEVS
jgi:hypothetical protein